MTTRGPQDEEMIGSKLKSLREDLPDDGFSARLHQRLVEAGAPKPTWQDRLVSSWKSWMWPLSGAVAGVAAYFLAASWAGNVTSKRVAVPVAAVEAPTTEQPGSMVPVSKVAVLKLNFTVDTAVEDADFQISLPEGLAFWVEGEALPERAFAWRQPLTEGENMVPIAVRGSKPGRYVVSAKARIGDMEIVHDVVLEVTSG